MLLALAICGCALAPRGFERSRYGSSVSVLPEGEVVVLGASRHGDLRLAPLHLGRRGRWSAGPTGPTRVDHTATILFDGRILVCGGRDSTTRPLESAAAEIYDPVRRTWRSVAPMHARRTGATAARLGDGRVLVHGGTHDAPGAAYAELYNPVTASWAVAEHFTACDRGRYLVALKDGRALLVADDCAATFDPLTERWTIAATPQRAHRTGTATALADGRVILVGGNNNKQTARVTELFDPETNTWTDGPTLKYGRGSHSTTLLDGVLVIAGGRRWGPILSGRRMHSVELVNLGTGTHRQRTLGVRRSDHLAVPIGSKMGEGDLFLIGGAVGVIFNNFPSHRYIRFRARDRWGRERPEP